MNSNLHKGTFLKNLQPVFKEKFAIMITDCFLYEVIKEFGFTSPLVTSKLKYRIKKMRHDKFLIII